MKKCTQCGECCRKATICDIRGWLATDRKPTIPKTGCEFLITNATGTTCLGIKQAFDNRQKNIRRRE